MSLYKLKKYIYKKKEKEKEKEKKNGTVPWSTVTQQNILCTQSAACMPSLVMNNMQSIVR